MRGAGCGSISRSTSAETGLRRLSEARLERVETRLRFGPHVIGRLVTVVERGRDEQNRAETVVENHEIGNEAERLARDLEVSGRGIRKVLELSNRFPADEADETAGQRRVALDARTSSSAR